MIHYFEYPADFYFPGESHDFWEALYVDKGTVEIGADERRHVLNEGQMIFHKPMEFHTIRALSGKAPNLFIISFNAKGTGLRYFENLVCELDDLDKHYISRIILESRRAFASPLNVPQVEQLIRLPGETGPAEQLIRNSLEILLIMIYRKVMNAVVPEEELGCLPRLSFLNIPDPASVDKRFIEITLFLAEHLEENFTVDEIARRYHLSHSHLEALFRKDANTGVLSLFHHLKIEKAKELIREGRMDLSEIAARLGYSSLSVFSKKFKSLTTMSPNAYKKSVKGYAGLDV